MLLKKNRKPDPWRLLRKMAEIAGHDFDDCVIVNEEGKEGWNYELTWTQAQSDRYERWFKKQLGKTYDKNKEWSWWNLQYGFKIREK